MYRLGIDLGGTKIEIAALDYRGEIVLRERVATPRDDYRSTLEAILGLVEMAENKLSHRCSVGIGTPGALSTVNGTLKNSNSTWLNGKPLKMDLEQILSRPVRMANDANCFALSEASDGAGTGAELVFGVILGTGVGGGLVVRGEVVNGCNGIGGEWGHNPLPWPGESDAPAPPCYCGRAGCIETYLSGPGMSRDHVAHGGPSLTAAAITTMASNDAAAHATLERYANRLARALAHIINVFDPHVIVLGGGMSNVDYLYQEVPKRWTEFVFSDTVLTRLVRAKHGDSSGVRGAAWLWPSR